ncbi:cytochrome c oxidase biogenesis protein Cmc1 like-domain-containing protein [Xylariaceae sp. FL0804]|nr:cytochrome c oxidase biogenesis protein Cmc1 like-domain-containing protein [Xylariaceae sp. FL0804]
MASNSQSHAQQAQPQTQPQLPRGQLVASIPRGRPVPLSASQEAQVREVFYKRVRKICDDDIRAFAECATGRTFSVSWACRQQKLAMTACMVEHATPEEHDRAREEWFAGRAQRALDRQASERRKLEQRAFLREWWNIPEPEPEHSEKSAVPAAAAAQRPVPAPAPAPAATATAGGEAKSSGANAESAGRRAGDDGGKGGGEETGHYVKRGGESKWFGWVGE